MKNSKYNRYSFSLIELLIAFSLGVFLLVSLFSVHVIIRQHHKKAREFSKGVLEEAYVFQRLQTLFTSILNTNESVFYTNGNSLIFTYDNGPDLNPSFSGSVLGQILVDEEDRLLLLTWSLEDPTHPKKEEIFMHSTNSISFSFFHPLLESRFDQWDKSIEFFPVSIKIVCRKSDNQLKQFSYEFSPSYHGLGDPTIKGIE